MPDRPHPWKPLARTPLLVLAATTATLAGCAALLPAGQDTARSGFASFEAAEAALARVTPYRTTLAELEALGFRVRESANVLHISYPDSVARLAPNSRVPLEDMDEGIRECIVSRSACQVYEFTFAHQVQRRVGSFLPDFFNFRRRTTLSGWRFKALVVVKDGKVLFTSYGGEPHTELEESRVNPLGPLQSSGEMSGSLLVR